MPTYTFRDNNTEKEWTEVMRISQMEDYLKDNPHVTLVPASPLLCDPVRVGITKPPERFNEVLKNVQKNHPKGTFNIR